MFLLVRYRCCCSYLCITQFRRLCNERCIIIKCDSRFRWCVRVWVYLREWWCVRVVRLVACNKIYSISIEHGQNIMCLYLFTIRLWIISAVVSFALFCFYICQSAIIDYYWNCIFWLRCHFCCRWEKVKSLGHVKGICCKCYLLVCSVTVEIDHKTVLKKKHYNKKLSHSEVKLRQKLRVDIIIRIMLPYFNLL